MAVLGFRCWAGFPLVAASRGPSRGVAHSLLIAVASLAEQLRLQGVQAVVAVPCGLHSWGSRALGHRLNSWGSRAWLPCCMWHLPASGIELTSPAFQEDSFPWSHQGRLPFFFLMRTFKIYFLCNEQYPHFSQFHTHTPHHHHPCTQTLVSTHSTPFLGICLLKIPPISDITQHLFFSIWWVSLNSTPSSFIQVFANGKIFLSFLHIHTHTHTPTLTNTPFSHLAWKLIQKERMVTVLGTISEQV